MKVTSKKPTKKYCNFHIVGKSCFVLWLRGCVCLVDARTIAAEGMGRVGAAAA